MKEVWCCIAPSWGIFSWYIAQWYPQLCLAAGVLTPICSEEVCISLWFISRSLCFMQNKEKQKSYWVRTGATFGSRCFRPRFPALSRRHRENSITGSHSSVIFLSIPKLSNISIVRGWSLALSRLVSKAHFMWYRAYPSAPPVRRASGRCSTIWVLIPRCAIHIAAVNLKERFLAWSWW
jgi:hypothetical protein